MQSNYNSPKSQLVFAKDFIAVGANPSIIPNLLFQRKLQKPQRSHISIRNMFSRIGNNLSEKKEEAEECQLRKSVTSQSRRKKNEQSVMQTQFSVLLRTIHRKPADCARSKTVGKCTRVQGENKNPRIAQLNKKIKESRDSSLKKMLTNSFNQNIGNGKPINRASNVKSTSQPKAKDLSVSLKQKHKSSGHFANFGRNFPFQVKQSSEILLSNLLNPQPEQKQLRKQSSDSAKRFYLKLKKNKLGNLWKPFDQEISLLDGQSVSKEIPSQLGIYKIMLPKRNYRHQFLQNIQKIKENYLRIRGNAQRVKTRNEESPSKSFQRTFKPKRKEKKMYQINYRCQNKQEEGSLVRSKTQFFQNRSQWQAFASSPLEPWDTQEINKRLR